MRSWSSSLRWGAQGGYVRGQFWQQYKQGGSQWPSKQGRWSDLTWTRYEEIKHGQHTNNLPGVNLDDAVFL